MSYINKAEGNVSDMHTASTLLLSVRHEETPVSTSDTQGTLPARVSDIKEGTPSLLAGCTVAQSDIMSYKNGEHARGAAAAYIVYNMNMPGPCKTMSNSPSGIAVNASDMNTGAQGTTVLPAMPPFDTTK